MSHYYENDNKLSKELSTIHYYYQDTKLSFYTSAGVFSRTSVDFGTHLLLESLIGEPLEEKRILDVGCGYGAIGISIAKLFRNSNVEMVDIVDQAIDLAIQNVKLNKVNNVKAFKSNLFETVEGSFDVVVSNPPIRAGKEVVHAIVDQAFFHLENQGSLYFVIQKKQGAISLQAKMNDVFHNAEILNKKSGYLILKSVKIDS